VRTHVANRNCLQEEYIHITWQHSLDNLIAIG